MSKIGIFITIVYIGTITLIRWQSFPKLATMPLNEFGDFFAGVFGPLMLLWLILGYMQQQKELQQNTAALELQAEELRKSVEQHKELVKATKEQVQTDQKALEIEQIRTLREAHPVFSITQAGQYSKAGNKIGFKIVLKNNGSPASGVKITTAPDIKEITNQDVMQYFDTGASINIVWNTETSGEAPELLKIIINCRDSNTKPYTKTFDLVLAENNHYQITTIAEVS